MRFQSHTEMRILLRKGMQMAARFDDITGKTYNRFTVVELARHDTENGVYYWKLKCECGKECVLPKSSFVYGSTKSCGCLLRERREKSRATRRARTPQFVERV